MKNVIFGLVGLLTAVSVSAESSTPSQEATRRGRWSFSAGPAWRANVKSRITGTATATPVNAGTSGVSYDKSPSDASTWGTLVAVDDPAYGATSYDQLWAVQATRTETLATPGSGAANLSTSDEDSPLGFNLAAGYDFYQGEMFSVGLNLRFAAFFDMKASSSGRIDAGSIRTIVSTDYFLFEDPPYPPTAIGSYPSTPNAEPYEPYREAVSDTTVAGAGSRYVSSRLESDLYQIALGPRMTWHALSWLDVYGGVDVLVNFAAMDFAADGSSTSEVETLLGFGGCVGLDAYLTDWFGVYGQVGYEWIDDAKVSAGGIGGEADFSSLVISAGVRFRF